MINRDEIERFAFMRSYFEATTELETKDGRLALYEAIARYMFLGEEPSFHGLEEEKVLRALWRCVLPVLNKSLAKSGSGKKGGENSRGGGAPFGNHNASNNSPF